MSVRRRPTACSARLSPCAGSVEAGEDTRYGRRAAERPASPEQPAAEPTLRAETDKTHAEKDTRIAPECALCAMPCGSTADGDMQAVWNAREPVRARKAALLQAACAAVQRLRPDEDGEKREAAMLALYRAVFALGEDWDPEALEAVCEALETAGR